MFCGSPKFRAREVTGGEEAREDFFPEMEVHAGALGSLCAGQGSVMWPVREGDPMALAQPPC